MFVLSKKQRENLSKALFDVGKLVLATVVLGQFISDKPVNLLIITFGGVGVLICFVIATILDK